MNEDREQGTTEYTTRMCRRCGRFYTWPKGSRRPGASCPTCQPELPFGELAAGAAGELELERRAAS